MKVSSSHHTITATLSRINLNLNLNLILKLFLILFLFLSGQYNDKAAFILCKTSNPSSKDLQEKKLLNGEVMYESVAKLCNSWNEKCTDVQKRT